MKELTKNIATKIVLTEKAPFKVKMWRNPGMVFLVKSCDSRNGLRYAYAVGKLFLSDDIYDADIENFTGHFEGCDIKDFYTIVTSYYEDSFSNFSPLVNGKILFKSECHKVS